MTDAEQAAAFLATALQAVDFTDDALSMAYGPALAALDRGEPAALWAATDGGSRLDTATRLFVLAAPVERTLAETVVGADTVAALVRAGVMDVNDQPTDAAGQAATATVCSRLQVRPHTINGLNQLVFADFPAAVTGVVPDRDHVPGSGAASWQLIGATPTTPVDSVLDLGCGGGIQMLAQWSSARTITGTDISVAALLRARLSCAAAQGMHPHQPHPTVTLSRGSWYEPVAGQRFDRIIANPPFVIAPPDSPTVYRESGLNLDGATEIAAAGAAEHLTDDGLAVILGSWVHLAEQDWRRRIASWFDDHGVEVRVIQRDVVDPALYVGTWLRDGSIDPHSADGVERASTWLDYLAAADVAAIGMGIITVKKRPADQPTEVICEQLLTPLRGPLAPEVADYFVRSQWLSGKTADDIAAARYRLADGVALEEVLLAADDGCGFIPAGYRLTRTDGPGFSHEIDEGLAAIVKGLNPSGLSLKDTVELYAAVSGDDSEQLVDAAVAAAVDLLRHGMIRPADLPL
ncbi:methyltransferase [Corynebacterium mendelii]|uniref:Methyltransferase n=1 Tax=Corynebacterium mendelii TaxID=2765362 RepID=A0A939IWE9_9CORY|nr:methyltransferase [Corynebacterium mendelii]